MKIKNTKTGKLLLIYADCIWKNIHVLVKWLVISILIGLFVGGVSTLFALFLLEVTAFRRAHSWVIFLLPLAGLFIVLMYRVMDDKDDKGTNLILSTIHAKSKIPLKIAPLIFTSTILTHLFGGSAGREGAALQLGGSIGQQLGKLIRLDENDQRLTVMCGMSAAFSAVFGTPLAAAIFPMEVVSVGIMHYSALLPCVFSSLIASTFAINMRVKPESFILSNLPQLQLIPSVKIMGLALCCAALSVIFCISLHSLGSLYRKHLKNPYVRVVVSSAIIILLTLLLQTDDYMGAGIPVIERAVEGEVVTLAFLWKIVFTALTLEAGFKGGEIVPSFFVGATFGCLFGQIFGISPSLCAAVGMISLFCGVTNCPISSMFISFELFGYHAVPYFLIGISVSYLMSGYFGLYHDQTIVYSKHRTEYINRKTRE